MKTGGKIPLAREPLIIEDIYRVMNHQNDFVTRKGKAGEGMRKTV